MSHGYICLLLRDIRWLDRTVWFPPLSCPATAFLRSHQYCLLHNQHFTCFFSMFKNHTVLKPALCLNQSLSQHCLRTRDPRALPRVLDYRPAGGSWGGGGCQALSAMLAPAGRTQSHSKSSLRCCSDENTMTRLVRKKRKPPVHNTWQKPAAPARVHKPEPAGNMSRFLQEGRQTL